MRADARSYPSLLTSQGTPQGSRKHRIRPFSSPCPPASILKLAYSADLFRATPEHPRSKQGSKTVSIELQSERPQNLFLQTISASYSGCTQSDIPIAGSSSHTKAMYMRAPARMYKPNLPALCVLSPSKADILGVLHCPPTLRTPSPSMVVFFIGSQGP